MTTVLGWDAEGGNLHLVPTSAGPYGGGYMSGSGAVPWTAAQKAAYPDAVMFDQSPSVEAVDYTADAFDAESGAIPVGSAELPALVKGARQAFTAVTRPGQREPAVYQSASNVTANVNALLTGGVTSCPLIVADYNLTQAEAEAIVTLASGPFPVVGVQYSDKGGGGTYDLDVWDLTWLNTRSAKVTTPPPQAFPAPTGLTAGTAHVSLPLSWNPVTLNGLVPVSYTVVAYGLDGHKYASQTVTGTTCMLSDLNHGWTYKIRVWANGGPVSPPHAEITVSV